MDDLDAGIRHEDINPPKRLPVCSTPELTWSSFDTSMPTPIADFSLASSLAAAFAASAFRSAMTTLPSASR
jgi:hypothetical protein